MKQAKRLTSAQERAHIMARAEQDRAGHDLGIKSVRVTSTYMYLPDGTPAMWATHEHPGPLDGKPRCSAHTCEFYIGDKWVNAHSFIANLR